MGTHLITCAAGYASVEVLRVLEDGPEVGWKRRRSGGSSCCPMRPGNGAALSGMHRRWRACRSMVAGAAPPARGTYPAPSNPARGSRAGGGSSAPKAKAHTPPVVCTVRPNWPRIGQNKPELALQFQKPLIWLRFSWVRCTPDRCNKPRIGQNKPELAIQSKAVDLQPIFRFCTSNKARVDVSRRHYFMVALQRAPRPCPSEIARPRARSMAKSSRTCRAVTAASSRGRISRKASPPSSPRRPAATGRAALRFPIELTPNRAANLDRPLGAVVRPKGSRRHNLLTGHPIHSDSRLLRSNF